MNKTRSRLELSTFTRTINKQEYIFDNGEFLVKKIKKINNIKKF